MLVKFGEGIICIGPGNSRFLWFDEEVPLIIGVNESFGLDSDIIRREVNFPAQESPIICASLELVVLEWRSVANAIEVLNLNIMDVGAQEWILVIGGARWRTRKSPEKHNVGLIHHGIA
jgi:hypothetical protein